MSEFKHHPSCKPSDSSVISKCYQCGLEESIDADLTLKEKDAEISRLKGEVEAWKSSSEIAWAVIANAGHRNGGWDSEHKEWVQCAEVWRDRYHELLRGEALAPEGKEG